MFRLSFICSEFQNFSYFEEERSTEEFLALKVELESGGGVWDIELIDFIDEQLEASQIFPELAGFAIEQDDTGHHEASYNLDEILVKDR